MMALGVPLKVSVLVVPEQTLNGLAAILAVSVGTVEMVKDWLIDCVQPLVMLVKLYTKVELTLGIKSVAVPLEFNGTD